MSTGGFQKPLEPRKLAHKGAVIKGNLGGDTLRRFRDAVVDDFEPLQCELSFYLDEEGHALIDGKAQGTVHLQCQRCLEPIAQTIDLNFSVRPVLTDAQAQAHQKSIDIVMLSSEGYLNSIEMIEDELLLGMPIVVYHDYDCAPTMQFGEEVAVEPDVQKENPFAILATMSRREKEE